MEDKIIEIIEELTSYKDLKNNKEVDLLDSEILDSLAFIELMSYLENEFSIEIQPTQVDPNIWRNINNITNLVKELQKQQNKI